jgi:hypothetical protein
VNRLQVRPANFDRRAGLPLAGPTSGLPNPGGRATAGKAWLRRPLRRPDQVRSWRRSTASESAHWLSTTRRLGRPNKSSQRSKHAIQSLNRECHKHAARVRNKLSDSPSHSVRCAYLIRLVLRGVDRHVADFVFRNSAERMRRFRRDLFEVIPSPGVTIGVHGHLYGKLGLGSVQIPYGANSMRLII